ncbi:hypothetical protein [Petroclostridium sp. X23]|jgi:mannitol-1-phosphate/altronate dehydrogenase|uniref:hypothetical protein n=1 Tax=Petroclostridium sp. X23 TaxID=3045146 RepID=UPI0024AE5D8F|nr:hypothetical protein [Petroclostridium sp. X23]WHH57102.1 hypothetical protein QKW49_14770 [Petroclostridium sp. X23]
MLPNMDKKMQQLLMNMDPEVLEKGLKAVSEMMNTPQGKQIAEQFKNIDKEKLMEQVNSIDKEELVKRMENLDIKDLNSKVDNINSEKLLKEIRTHPELMKKMNDLMNK